MLAGGYAVPETAWTARFHVKQEGSVAGFGLFAARTFRPNEYLTVYATSPLHASQTDLGIELDPTCIAARAALAKQDLAIAPQAFAAAIVDQAEEVCRLVLRVVRTTL